jgi:hypothetical protein
MATRRSAFAVPVAEFAAALLVQLEVCPRAQATAEQVAQLLPGTAVVVYIPKSGTIANAFDSHF